MQQSSNLPAASTNPETEAPCWMVKDVRPQGAAAPSGTCFLPAITETVVTNLNPVPGSEAQTSHKPAFSAAQLLTGADQDHINVLVQMTPRPVRPAWSEEIIKTPAVDHDWGKANLDEDAWSRQASLAGSRNDAPAAKNIKPVCPETKPAPPALNSRDNDISACLRVTEINPANDRAWDALGSKYDAAGLYSEAIAAYEQAISLCPQKEVYYYHLGIAFGYQMRYDKAIQALEKVLALDPKFMLAHCALAGYYRKLGKEAEAREHVAIARPSMETETEYNQACFESISGDADRALELLATAFEKQQVQPAMVQNDPDLDFIRADPRFEILLAKNGIFRQ
jgi:tetratricopeptide (TPR) repeat protein